MGDDGGGGTDSPDGVVSRWFVSAPALVFFPCAIKSQRWRAVVEEVDKGCSKFCVIGTVTRTAVMLIYSRLKVLAVNLSQPSG